MTMHRKKRDVVLVNNKLILKIIELASKILYLFLILLLLVGFGWGYSLSITAGLSYLAISVLLFIPINFRWIMNHYWNKITLYVISIIVFIPMRYVSSSVEIEDFSGIDIFVILLTAMLAMLEFLMLTKLRNGGGSEFH
jgi:hypothetical protein